MTSKMFRLLASDENCDNCANEAEELGEVMMADGVRTALHCAAQGGHVMHSAAAEATTVQISLK